MSDYTTDYIEIPLTQGKVALVSTEDAELSQHKWCAHAHRMTYYARRNLPRSNGKQTNIKMHRVILARMLGRDLAPAESVDHINGDGLDNRRCNLRLASNQQNSFNRRIDKNSISGYKGVCWNKQCRKWQAEITVSGKKKYLGLFDTPEEAHQAYCEAALKYHGEFANFGTVDNQP